MRNLQGAIDTQAEKILTNTLKEIDEVLLDLRSLEGSIVESARVIKQIEDAHAGIDKKIETILQDYKKIHSAFEIVELELKKTASAIDSVKIEMVALLDETNKKNITLYQSLSSNIESVKAEMIEKLNEANKQVKITRETLVERIETAKNEGLQHFNEVSENNHNKLMKGIYVSIGLSACAVILSMISLFL